MFQEQHDISVQWNASLAGGEIYAAYSPIKYLGFSAAYSYNKDTFGSVKRAYHDAEFSLIPYYSYKILRLEMPVGYGYLTNKDLITYHISQPYNRIFFQPTVGVSWDNFDIALINRFTIIDYANPVYMTDNRFETGLLFRGGIKNVKAMMQFSVENGTNNSMKVDYYPLHLGVGLNFYFNAKDFKKKKKVTEPAPAESK
jgi:hypothetical protein